MAVNTERLNRQALVKELIQAGVKGFKGNVCACPFHDDTHPSAGIYPGDDGVWRFKCQACGEGGDVFDIRAKVTGRGLNDILREASGNKAKPVPAKKIYNTMADLRLAAAKLCNGIYEATYIYKKDNKPYGIVLRIKLQEGKRFFQASPTTGGYVFSAPPKPWPLYNLEKVRQAKKIVVVEGEKPAEVLMKLGYVATTSVAGAGNSKHSNWSPLSDKDKEIYLWGDNDQPGIDHMQEVRRILESLELKPKIFCVDPTSLDLPEKGDVVNFAREIEVLSGDVVLEINSVLSKAKSCCISSELAECLEDVISGKRKAIGWPWPQLSLLTQSLLPQTVTILCGDPGATKSFMLLQSLTHWCKHNIKVAVFELEEDRKYHLGRVLAQVAENSELCNLSWVKENPNEVRAAYNTHKEFLDEFGECIDEAPSKQQSLEGIAEWIERKAKACYRIICIDPITAAVATSQPWVSDSKFVNSIKAIVRKYETSLILITHPKKGRAGFGLDDLAGGAVYQRLAQTIFWVQYHKKKNPVKVKTDCGMCQIEVNRTIHICKARNGRGTGFRLGYVFDSSNFLMSEQGIIASG